MKNFSLLDGLTIPCGHCGADIPLPAQKSGAVVTCPKCHTKNRIEYDSSINDVEKAEEKLNKLFD